MALTVVLVIVTALGALLVPLLFRPKVVYSAVYQEGSPGSSRRLLGALREVQNLSLAGAGLTYDRGSAPSVLRSWPKQDCDTYTIEISNHGYRVANNLAIAVIVPGAVVRGEASCLTKPMVSVQQEVTGSGLPTRTHVTGIARLAPSEEVTVSIQYVPMRGLDAEASGTMPEARIVHDEGCGRATTLTVVRPPAVERAEDVRLRQEQQRAVFRRVMRVLDAVTWIGALLFAIALLRYVARQVLLPTIGQGPMFTAFQGQ